jgi:uncharacterized protein YkwD
MRTFKPRTAITAARFARVIAVAGVLTVLPTTGVALGAGDPRATSASCADTSLVPTRANATRVEAATLCLINVQRQVHGRRALRANADLARSAAAHSEDMVSENYFNHVSPAGETPLERIKASTYLPVKAAYLVGENIALGTAQLSTPTAIVASWMKSPDHRANILNPDFRDTGVGVVAQAPGKYSAGQRGATYARVNIQRPPDVFQ